MAETEPIPDGTPVTILEEDDGSGWVKVKDQFGGKGLVPASYIEISADPTGPELAAPNPPSGGGQSGKLIQLSNSLLSNVSDPSPRSI